MSDNDPFLIRYLPGDSPEWKKVRQIVSVANSRTAIALQQPVLLIGEPGAGKSYVAEVIAAHRAWLDQPEKQREAYIGPRPNLAALSTTPPFASRSVPGIPRELIQSELFGHREGAFTGAVADRTGLFGNEDITDLLLDEIGDADRVLQMNLLAVLQERKFSPLGAGADEVEETNARVLLATNCDLVDLVRRGLFREDLYWRIEQLVIEVPPLRSSPENIPAVMEAVRKAQFRKAGLTVGGTVRTRSLTADDHDWAKGHSWPGNVRELERLVRVWLSLEEQVSLETVFHEFPVVDPRSEGDRGQGMVRSAVLRWVEELRLGRRAAPGKLGTLAAQISSIACSAIAEAGLSTEELERLFPEQKLASIRSTLSRWRNRDQQERDSEE